MNHLLIAWLVKFVRQVGIIRWISWKLLQNKRKNKYFAVIKNLIILIIIIITSQSTTLKSIRPPIHSSSIHSHFPIIHDHSMYFFPQTIPAKMSTERNFVINIASRPTPIGRWAWKLQKITNRTKITWTIDSFL